MWKVLHTKSETKLPTNLFYLCVCVCVFSTQMWTHVIVWPLSPESRHGRLSQIMFEYLTIFPWTVNLNSWWKFTHKQPKNLNLFIIKIFCKQVDRQTERGGRWLSLMWCSGCQYLTFKSVGEGFFYWEDIKK